MEALEAVETVTHCNWNSIFFSFRLLFLSWKDAEVKTQWVCFFLLLLLLFFSCVWRLYTALSRSVGHKPFHFFSVTAVCARDLGLLTLFFWVFFGKL